MFRRATFSFSMRNALQGVRVYIISYSFRSRFAVDLTQFQKIHVFVVSVDVCAAGWLIFQVLVFRLKEDDMRKIVLCLLVAGT